MLECKIVSTSEEKNLFLGLPKKLYSSNVLTQDEKLESRILNKKHTLSNDFEIYPFIVLMADEIVARAILTVYENDTTGYVGFFECTNNQVVADCLLNNVRLKAKELGLVKLLGPLDCSFWIKYRFKTNHFDKYYTNEPYNLEYYKDLWENWGFVVCDSYYSNQMKVPTDEDNQEKCKKRLEKMIANGYEFKNPTNKTFNNDLRNIFRLMTKVYSRFSAFKPITEEQFVSMYDSLKYVVNYDMVFLAYKNKELCGFFVTVPNYSNLIFNLNLLNFTNIFSIKNNCKEYVMLYMGASPEHLGLGGSFAELAKNYLKEHNCTSIGALIHEGNSSGVFYKNLIEDKYTYVLMETEV